MAVPKAACSSVKACLALIDPAKQISGPDELDLMDIHKLYPTRRHRPYRFRQYRGWWRFCVLRDPVKRLMSVYSDVVDGRELLRCSPKLRSGRVNLPVDPSPDFFFQNLETYMRKVSVIKHHALSARLFVGPDLSQYDRVYKVSELDDMARDLRIRTRFRARVLRFNKSREPISFDDLKPQTRDALRPFLKKEYALMDGLYDDVVS